MPQALARVILHITFSTKHRRPFLKDSQIRTELHAYIAASLHKIDCEPILINSVEDHIHILGSLSRTVTIARFVETAKTSSSKWVKAKGACYKDFSWQTGYGAFSVSQSNIGKVSRYIASQQEHHAHTTFQDEFRALCRKHHVELDEKYAWD
jgi:putative transposase